MSKENQATNGPWEVVDRAIWDISIRSAGGGTVCHINNKGEWFPKDEGYHGRSQNNMLADAFLISEAGTVLHETGLTPRQLVEQRAALLEALRSTRGVLACALKSAAPDFFETDEDVSDHIQIKKIDAAIALAQGDAA
jgi:hypothetical protein